MKNIKNYTLYIFAAVTAKLIAFCPRSLFFVFSYPIAAVMFMIPQIGKISMMNLATVFPDLTYNERKKIALESIRNLYVSLCEFFWSKGRRDIIEKYVAFDSVADETAKAAHKFSQEYNKGALFVTPHIGNWEFAGMALALHYKFDLGTVVRTPQNPYMDRIISSGRQVDGVKIIYSKGAARAMLKRVREGASLGVLIDQNTRISEGGAFVNFCGLPVPVSMVPAHLARREGLFCAVGATFRVGKKFESILRPLSKMPSEYASDEELTQEIMNITEEFVRKYPGQYLWMYKRFQNIPREATDELKKKYPSYAKVASGRFYERKKSTK